MKQETLLRLAAWGSAFIGSLLMVAAGALAGVWVQSLLTG